MFGNKISFSCQSNLPFCGDDEEEIRPKTYRGLPQASHGIKQIATAGATNTAVTEKVWGEYVSAVCQILAK